MKVRTATLPAPPSRDEARQVAERLAEGRSDLTDLALENHDESDVWVATVK